MHWGMESAVGRAFNALLARESFSILEMNNKVYNDRFLHEIEFFLSP